MNATQSRLTDPNRSVRHLLIAYRNEIGLSRGQLATRLGVNYKTLSQWEVGVARPPKWVGFAILGLSVAMKRQREAMVAP